MTERDGERAGGLGGVLTGDGGTTARRVRRTDLGCSAGGKRTRPDTANRNGSRLVIEGDLAAGGDVLRLVSPDGGGTPTSQGLARKNPGEGLAFDQMFD